MLFFPEFFFSKENKIEKNHVIKTTSDGTIVDIIPFEKIKDNNDIIHLKGLLIPGLINSHCHLELSWAEGYCKANKGIEVFYDEMKGIHNKAPSNENINSSIEKIITHLKKQGVVAVADTSNTSISISEKKKSNIYFHTFLEIVGADPEKAQEIFDNITKTSYLFYKENLSSSISIHTLFTLSNRLMELSSKEIKNNRKANSIHFLESIEEKNYYEKKNLFKFSKESKYNSATEAACKLLPLENRTLFVHNTFATKQDLDTILNNFNDAWFCFCPSSNLFISNKLADIPMFYKKTSNILIGTDSICTNKEMDLFNDIDIILKNYPELKIEQLLMAATINGAKFLNIEKQYGSIEKNKKPGLIQVEDYKPGLKNFKDLKRNVIF